jgi:hypothetical protein
MALFRSHKQRPRRTHLQVIRQRARRAARSGCNDCNRLHTALARKRRVPFGPQVEWPHGKMPRGRRVRFGCDELHGSDLRRLITQLCVQSHVAFRSGAHPTGDARYYLLTVLDNGCGSENNWVRGKGVDRLPRPVRLSKRVAYCGKDNDNRKYEKDANCPRRVRLKVLTDLDQNFVWIIAHINHLNRSQSRGLAA